MKWVDKTERDLNEKFNCINGVEFSFYHIKEILETTTFSIIPFMIKTHIVCVFGEDLKVYLPNYRADKALGNHHLINLKNQVEQAKKDLDGNKDMEDILDCCSWIMKIIVRAGLALVIEKEKRYTRDLYPAYKIFSRYYPEKESMMKQALKCAIKPVGNANEIIDILDDLGNWLISETEKWLEVNNPRKISNLEIKNKRHNSKNTNCERLYFKKRVLLQNKELNKEPKYASFYVLLAYFGSFGFIKDTVI